jgi:hypothetical protein
LAYYLGEENGKMTSNVCVLHFLEIVTIGPFLEGKDLKKHYGGEGFCQLEVCVSKAMRCSLPLNSACEFFFQVQEMCFLHLPTSLASLDSLMIHVSFPWDWQSADLYGV